VKLDGPVILYGSDCNLCQNIYIYIYTSVYSTFAWYTNEVHVQSFCTALQFCMVHKRSICTIFLHRVKLLHGTQTKLMYNLSVPR